ncbi:MAG: SRPBCC domain-containing protein [Actinomycetota bacterium]|nr:SRPBCC domain-containing protein [Actinomycetota bacterium]
MELNNDFRVGVDRDTTWQVLTDLERIAPMLPGAQLQEVEGDEYRGIVKVKVGPIQAQYKGTATLVETDQSAGKMVMKASGRDTRGQGNASATITLTMTADGSGTKVTANTDLTISGKVAQFGRGVLADVSSKLIGQFVDNLEADLNAGKQDGAPSNPGPGDDLPDKASGEALVGNADKAESNGSTASSQTASGPVGPGTTAPTTTAASSTSGRTNVASSDKSTGPRAINSPEPEPVDLFDAAGSTMKRAAPVVGVVVVILIAILLRRRRKASRAAKVAALVDVSRKARKQAAKRGGKAAVEGRKAAKQVAAEGRKAAKQVAAEGRKAAKKAAVHGRKAGKQAAVKGRIARKQGRQVAASARHAAEDASRRAAKRSRRAAVKAAAKAQKRASQVG